MQTLRHKIGARQLIRERKREGTLSLSQNGGIRPFGKSNSRGTAGVILNSFEGPRRFPQRKWTRNVWFSAEAS